MSLLLRLWLMLWSVSFAGLPFVLVIEASYSVHCVQKDLMVFHGMFKVWDIFFFQLTLIWTSPQLCLWADWRAPWCYRWFRTGVFTPMSCDPWRDTLIAHRWTLYTDFSILYDSWSELVGPHLIQGFHSKKGVNTCALTILRVYFFSFLSFFRSNNWDSLVRSVKWNPNGINSRL